MKYLITTLLFCVAANAQVQVIADTMGKGKTAYFIAGNILTAQDLPTVSFAVAQYWYGATKRIDVFGGATAATLLGQTQLGLSAGANINLLKSKIVSVSAFNTLSAALHRRRDSCGAIWFTALVASKNLRVGKFEFSPYFGYSVAVPLAHTTDKLFSPPEPVHNVPVGVMIPKGKFAFFAEYDFGRVQTVAGIGIAYTP